MNGKTGNSSTTGLEVAVIGMSGKFPGAGNIYEFWENLKNGVESISFYSEEEFHPPGVNGKINKNTNYVSSSGGRLENKEYFDAAFFNYTPKEAEMMDPQIRLFHGCAWEALEDAGYDPDEYHSLIGLYAGASSGFFWESLALLSGKMNQLGHFASGLFTDRDFLCARVSYNLHLNGPACAIQTACSTSLVAIHLACQGLLNGECDMALAGGVSLSFGQSKGYLYRQDMINSPDGHCRAFDAKAKGTTPGSGIGVVVLKRLKDAVMDSDHIDALIKGSAINNDGNRKVGFTAPSVKAQAEVIRTAQEMAEVEPESVTYIETHGTGTPMGDPVEIRALKKAFNTNKKKFCRIGSLKTNMGHLNCAAGVAGFIKTVLSLKYKLIPPSLHYETPNPEIDFKNSPFYVNTGLSKWKNEEYPLRAGVSSFGIGGTNAHVILEQAPNAQSAERKAESAERKAHSVESQRRGGVTPPSPSKEYQLILLSAKTETALDKMTENLAEYFKKNLLNPGNSVNPGLTLADIAFTLQVGRRHFQYRKMTVGADVKEMIAVLSSSDPAKIKTFTANTEERPVVLMFPGLGSQYVNMGRELYQKEPVFRQEMDHCFEILNQLTDYNIKEIMYPAIQHYRSNRSNWSYKSYKSNIHQLEIAQLVVFIFEYALARLLIKWGIKPFAMIGYSFGEYTTACISGVLSLEHALKLIVTRGRLTRGLPPGGMISVPLPYEELTPLLDSQLSVAIDNGPSCIAAGPVNLVDLLEKQMKERKLMCIRLNTNQAPHSPMVEPVLKVFKEQAGRLQFNKPAIPYISNVTGKWITVQEATDPGYWSNHLRETVRFADGIKELLKNENAVFLEIGPGSDLSQLLERYLDNHSKQKAIPLVRRQGKDISDIYYLLNQIGRVWLYGQHIDWSGFNWGKKRKRVSLPTYPFEGRRYWIEGDPVKMGTIKLSRSSGLAKKPNIADWFYIPQWKRSTPPSNRPAGISEQSSCWLLFINKCPLTTQLAKQLKHNRHRVITVEQGTTFSRKNKGEYTIDPRQSNGYHALFKELAAMKTLPEKILHMWSITGKENGGLDIGEIEKAGDRGFYSMIYMTKAIAGSGISHEIHIGVVTDHLQEVTGEEMLRPEKAAVLAPVKVVPQEYPSLTCRAIDVLLPEPGTPRERELANQIIEEMKTKSADKVIAYRGNYRWVQTFEAVRWEKNRESVPKLRKGGVYLVTGGLGNIGSLLATYLAQQMKAKLILTGRTPLPPRHKWQQWLDNHEKANPVSQKIWKVKELEQTGSKVLVYSVDVSDREGMQTVISQVEKELGPIHGVIHAAGDIAASSICTVDRLEREQCEQQFKPKVYGLLVLEEILGDREMDFFLLTSSLSPILGGLGFSAYAAANCFMDTFAHRRNRKGHTPWISVNWADWQFSKIKTPTAAASIGAEAAQLAIEPEEGVETFTRILYHCKQSQVTVSAGDLQTRLAKWVQLESLQDQNKSVSFPKDIPAVETRPDVLNPYIAPGNRIEQKIIDIWKELLGFQQIGIEDDFFEMGGDSLTAITAISKIHKSLNVLLPFPEFFKRRTARGIAEYVYKAGTQKYLPIPLVETKEYYELSSAQKRLFLWQQMDPGATGYNNLIVHFLEGFVHISKLERTFRLLIRRHEALRTSFKMIGKKGVQIIHEYNDIVFEIQHHQADEKEVGQLLGDFIKPFDLSKAPMMRLGLIHLDKKRYLLVYDIHHIIMDGVSYEIFRREFKQLFAENDLPGSKLQYKDFCQWQNHLWGTKKIEEQENYWLNQFKDGVPELDLPVDYPRPAVEKFAGAQLECLLDRELSKKIHSVARRTETTIYMVLLTAYYILLSKYTQKQDIVVGSPVAGRNHPDLENIIGTFANMLALRNRPEGDKSFEKFLAEVKQNLLASVENQDYQFEELLNQLEIRKKINPGLKKSNKRNFLFDVVLAMQHPQMKAPKYPANQSKGILNIQQHRFETGTSVFDLLVSAVDSTEFISLTLEYSSELFKRSTMEKLKEHYIEILEQAAENPEVEIKNINLSYTLLKADSDIFQDEEMLDFQEAV